MIRSRVSLATGWMSEGSGPAVEDINGDHTGDIQRKTSNRRVAATLAPIGSAPDAVCQHRAPCGARSSGGFRSGRSWSSSGTGSDWGKRRGGATFYVRSARAAAHVLRAPGQLGLGRAYVSGEIEVDDMDAVIELLGCWQPPALTATISGRCCSARRAPPA